MKQVIIVIWILLFCGLNIHAQQIDIQVVFNNTLDMKLLNSDIQKLTDAVKSGELKTALSANRHVTANTLKIRVAYFDRKAIGSLALNQINDMDATGYIDQWKKEEKGHAVLFLFLKETTTYKFNRLAVSDILEEQHLFPLVMEFINEHLRDGTNEDIISNGTKYLAKAITPVWTEGKMAAAEALVTNDRYKKNHINYFHNAWKSTFMDIRPLHRLSPYANNPNLAKVYFYNAASKDTLKPGLAIYADTTIFKNSEITLSGEGYELNYGLKTFTSLLSKTKERILLVQPKSTNSEHQEYIFNLVKAMDDARQFSTSRNVSDWDWNKSDGMFTLRSTNGLQPYQQGDKFELIMVNMNTTYAEGAMIPVIHPWYPRTFCNVYASDLARDILFPGVFTSKEDYAPWGSHQSAAKLHEVIMGNTNGHFKAVSFDDAWKYTNAGYVTYLSAYHYKYYTGKAGKYDNSGHIATCYSTPNYNNFLDASVIQAGEKTIKLTFNLAWGTDFGQEREYVKANLYLGYIIK